MDNCFSCIYAEWDYFEAYGGQRRYFVDGCKKDCDIENSEDCKEYEEIVIEV